MNTGLAGNTKPQVTPIIVEPGRTMLPLRFIAENLGSKVDWDAGQKEVTVTYPAP
nr:stalk domain-containing protein [Pelotomaculum propionicicum]